MNQNTYDVLCNMAHWDNALALQPRSRDSGEEGSKARSKENHLPPQ